MAAACPTRPLDAFQMHPLELIPWFRRYPPGILRDLVYTAIWNTLLAAAFTVVGLLFTRRLPLVDYAWWNFVFAHCIGYTIHLLFAVGEAVSRRPLRERSFAARVAFYAGIPMAGIFIGYFIGATLLGWVQMRVALLTPRGIVSIALMSLLLTGLIAALVFPRERAARAEAAAAREQARAAAAEREAALAQMKALEAQVEPHFLYNTLAHVASLIDTDPRAARTMLDRLIALLRASARGASEPATLGAQADHVRDWLEILALRMGSRLAWHVDVPPELRDAAVPPALLQPLVENAIKHGLEPKVAGGRVDVTARREGAQLVVTVEDSGVGFAHGASPLVASSGVGLASLRARLAALHGERASVTISERQPAGVRVSVRLPAAGAA
jgi:signal transduction histidine kinase